MSSRPSPQPLKPGAPGKPKSAGPLAASEARPALQDVLASRYASRPLLKVWSAEGKIVLERELWVAVLKAQRALGLSVSEQVLRDYERVKEHVDLASIEKRERALRHDVKARIEEFCALAGHEAIHQGMTSRDLTENVEQLQVRTSLELLREKTAAALLRLSELAAQYRDTPLVSRTHLVPAQPTTLGKRLAMTGEELLRAFDRLDGLVQTYPLRGLKGAVGTQLDQITLLGGAEAALQLEQALAKDLRFGRLLENVGQVYPRSLDFEVVSALYQVAAALGDFAKSMRLMTGFELVSEGFLEEQVGSSSMPHKMNARTCERINGMQAIVAGFMEMTARLAGDQWLEGDVSCSVVRRVALPGAMFALDGALEGFLHVAEELEVYESTIAAEVRRYLPFLATTTLLMEGLKRGGGREELHHVLRVHAVAAERGLREGTVLENDLPRRLGADPAFPMSEQEVRAVLADPGRFLGAAPRQVDKFVAQTQALAQRFPGGRIYRPEPML